MVNIVCRFLLPFALLLCAARAYPDAIVRTQAMFATTIAEYFIESERIRVELEIGLADLPAFVNLLPDEIYEKLGNSPVPLRERAARFFAEDLVIQDAAGQPLPGRIMAIGPRQRVQRDAVSGEAGPAGVEAPGGVEDDETVIFAQLEYRLDEEPTALTLNGLPGGRAPASVGFVVYHRGIPVNDFRYLSPRQVLQLDWVDPWYTRFEARNLRRTYFAPMSGFLYIEPYEVRKEIVLRPLDLQDWVDLGLEGRETIPVDMQPELLQKVAGFLRTHQPVAVDGESVVPELARINFLERTLRTSRVVDPPVELDAHAAIIGAIFVYPTDGLPHRVTMTWDLFNERIQEVPAAAVDQAGPLPTILEPDYAVLEWQNFLKHPELPTLEVLAPPPTRSLRALLSLRWVALIATALLLVRCLVIWRRGGGRLVWAVAVLLTILTTAASFLASREAILSDAKARTVIAGLLHNVYRAFDFRDEERIYDVLEKSVHGELLTQIYLETRKGLELANQGGARAKVKTIDLVELSAEPAGDGGFMATTSWNVSGSVGHWGHVHQRRNRYEAKLAVAPVDGAWKLMGMEILEEARVGE